MKRFLAVLAIALSLALISLIDGIDALEFGSILALTGFSLVVFVRSPRGREGADRADTLMRHVVQNSLDAIVTADERGRIETLNRTAEKMFGYGENEAIGLPLQQIVGATEQDPPGSLLATVGLKKGDTITGLNGQPINSLEEGSRVVSGIAAGDEVEIKLLDGRVYQFIYE